MQSFEENSAVMELEGTINDEVIIRFVQLLVTSLLGVFAVAGVLMLLNLLLVLVR